MVSKKQLFISLFPILFSVYSNAFDYQQCDKLMTHYIKNDADQFKQFLEEYAATVNNNAELYNKFQTLSIKFNELNDFYSKKRDKRAQRGKKNFVNALFYSVASILSLAGSGYFIATQTEEINKIVVGGIGITVATVFAWLANNHLTASIVEYNFFPKLLRKNNKFRAIVEKFKKATALQMEVQLPMVDGVKLEVE